MNRGARPRGWLYAAAWTPYVGIYLAAFVVSGLPLGLAVRNAVANALPAVLLGLVLLPLPARLPPPTWAYVRDILLPQIETAQRQGAKGK